MTNVSERSADNDGSQPPQIPQYSLIRKIGVGAFGEVWIARSATQRLVAVKIVRRSSFSDDAAYEREFNAIQRYEPLSGSHSNLVTVLHVGREDTAQFYFYVMELADDITAGREIVPDRYSPKTLKPGVVLPPAECVEIGAALASALQHLHSAGLVHRDVKLSNVVFVNGVPKLADVGLASEIGRSGSRSGTKGYLPPEGGGSPSADLYALGKVLYELSTGRDRLEFPQVSHAIPDGAVGKTWQKLNQVLLTACENSAVSRFPSAASMSTALGACLSSGAPPRLPAKPGFWGAAALGLVLILLSLQIRQGCQRAPEPKSARSSGAPNMDGWGQDIGKPGGTLPSRAVPGVSRRRLAPATEKDIENARLAIDNILSKHGDTAELVDGYRTLAMMYYELGHTNEAGQTMQQAVKTARSLGIQSYEHLPELEIEYAQLLESEGMLDRASAVAEGAVSNLWNTFGPRDERTGRAHIEFMKFEVKQGKVDQIRSGCDLVLVPLDLTLDQVEKLDDGELPADPRIPQCLVLSSLVAARNGEADIARVRLQKAIRLTQRDYEPSESDLVFLLQLLGKLCEEDGLTTEALDAYKRAIRAGGYLPASSQVIRDLQRCIDGLQATLRPGREPEQPEDAVAAPQPLSAQDIPPIDSNIASPLVVAVEPEQESRALVSNIAPVEAVLPASITRPLSIQTNPTDDAKMVSSLDAKPLADTAPADGARIFSRDTVAHLARLWEWHGRNVPGSLESIQFEGTTFWLKSLDEALLEILKTEGRRFEISGEIRLESNPSDMVLNIFEATPFSRYEIGLSGIRVKRRMLQGRQIETFATPLRFREPLVAGVWYAFRVAVGPESISIILGPNRGSIRGPFPNDGMSWLSLRKGRAYRNVRIEYLD